MKSDYDVLIIGGGPAGLSAAMTLGRIKISALLCDNQQPRNYPSQHVNNFPPLDGIHPNEWRRMTIKNLQKYPSIVITQDSVLRVSPSAEGNFQAQLGSGAVLYFKKIILASGVQDVMLPLPGFQELWGYSIFHCPFCHGFEIQGSDLGFIIKNPMGLHTLPLLKQLANKLMVFTDGPHVLNAQQIHQLQSQNIPVFEESIKDLLVDTNQTPSQLKGLKLTSNQEFNVPYLFYAAEKFQLKSDIPAQLGCQLSALGLIECDDLGRTSVPGVFACGDHAHPMQSVLLAASSGVKAASTAIFEVLNPA